MATKKAAAKKPANATRTRKAKARTPAAYQKQRDAIALRSAGLTYREIGTTLKIDYSYAYELVQAGMKENVAEDIQHLREEDDMRLMKLLRAAWEPAMTGSPQHIIAALRILERRARLWGLDSPIGVDATVTHHHDGAVLVIDGETTESFLKSLEKAKPPNLKAVG